MFTVRTAPKEKKKKNEGFSGVKNIHSARQFGSAPIQNMQKNWVIVRHHLRGLQMVPFHAFIFYFPPLFPKPKPLTAAALLLLQCLLHFKHCRLHTARLQHCPAWRTCLKWSWCADRPLAQRHLEGEAAPRPHSKLPIAMEGFSPFIRTWAFHTIGLLGEHLEMGSTVCLGTWSSFVELPMSERRKYDKKRHQCLLFF